MEILVCDICKDKKKEAFKYSFCFDHKFDAAGSVYHLWEDYDLCKDCRIRILEDVISIAIPSFYDRGKAKLDAIKELIKFS